MITKTTPSRKEGRDRSWWPVASSCVLVRKHNLVVGTHVNLKRKGPSVLALYMPIHAPFNFNLHDIPNRRDSFSGL